MEGTPAQMAGVVARTAMAGANLSMSITGFPRPRVVHHEAQVQTVHHDAVYGTGVECNGCFAQFNSYEAWLAHSDSQLDNGNNNCMGYHTIKIVLEQAWDETVEVSPAWDETVTTGYTCSCGAVK